MISKVRSQNCSIASIRIQLTVTLICSWLRFISKERIIHSLLNILKQLSAIILRYSQIPWCVFQRKLSLNFPFVPDTWSSPLPLDKSQNTDKIRWACRSSANSKDGITDSWCQETSICFTKTRYISFHNIHCRSLPIFSYPIYFYATTIH